MAAIGTKAETLAMLYNKLSEAEVLSQYLFTVGEWKYNKRQIYDNAIRKLGKESKLIVRSSALNEDTLEISQAGKYESVTNVFGREVFETAVDRVIASYDIEDEKNQVLVQPMLEEVTICGVAFTLDPNTLGNYYVINYDETGSTSSITSGISGENKLLYVFKSQEGKQQLSDTMLKLYRTLEELEEIFESNTLDVEFAITGQGDLYIFQVRPLCISEKAVEYHKQYSELKLIEEKIKGAQTKKPYLCGDKTLYGVMTDWNPAEMIGVRPKQLALSLYKEIITDSVWAYQRDNYGYRNLRSFPLMVDFDGLPYIDIRVSFNSFIPAELDEKISEKLVNYYIERLKAEPVKHDKIEFDIVFSCYTLDLPERISILKEYDFSDLEIQKIIIALRNVTNRIIDHKSGLWRVDISKIRELEKRYDKIIDSDMEDLEKIYWLLEDCKRYGTLPFAGLARAAFIAVQILQSLITKEIISREDYQCFMNDVNTVSSNLKEDFSGMSKLEFLNKYGHLRPGTYDITSKRYDEAPDIYFDWDKREKHQAKEDKLPLKLSLGQLTKFSNILKENGLNDNILELMDFVKSAIEAREYGKFIFTKNLSKIIQMIGQLGEKYEFSKEDCAYINILDISELYSSTKDIRKNLSDSIRRGKELYDMTKTIDLPPLIMSSDEVWKFFYPDTEPNYITMGTACGEVIFLENVYDDIEINGKILLIPSADPGFDWIFSHNILGFITKYGGANSHMAIRAGELGIPAAIGVGTKKFEQYKKASYIEIDALAKIVRIIK